MMHRMNVYTYIHIHAYLATSSYAYYWCCNNTCVPHTCTRDTFPFPMYLCFCNHVVVVLFPSHSTLGVWEVRERTVRRYNQKGLNRTSISSFLTLCWSCVMLPIIFERPRFLPFTLLLLLLLLPPAELHLMTVKTCRSVALSLFGDTIRFLSIRIL